MFLSGIGRLKGDISWAIYPLLLGCLLHTIFGLISVAECSPNPGKSIKPADVGKYSKQHLPRRTDRKSGLKSSSGQWVAGMSKSVEYSLHSIESKVNKINTNLERFLRALQPAIRTESNYSRALDDAISTLNNGSIDRTDDQPQNQTEIQFSSNLNQEGSLENYDENKNPLEQITTSQYISDGQTTVGKTESNYSRALNDVISTPNNGSINRTDDQTQNRTEIQLSSNLNSEGSPENYDENKNPLEQITTSQNNSNGQTTVGKTESNYSRALDDAISTQNNGSIDRTYDQTQNRTEIQSSLNLISEGSTENYDENKNPLEQITTSQYNSDDQTTVGKTPTSLFVEFPADLNSTSQKKRTFLSESDTTEAAVEETPPENDDSDTRTPIPVTMEGVPGLDGKDEISDQPSVTLFTSEQENRPLKEQSLDVKNEYPTADYHRPEFDQYVGEERSVEEKPLDTRNEYSNHRDSKPYTWKRVCFQGVDKMHFSLDEHVIKLPDNNADVYFFYYIPELMNLHRLNDSVYLPNDMIQQYKGGYLKHNFDHADVQSRSYDDYTAHSLDKHRQLLDYRKPKPETKLSTKLGSSKPSTNSTSAHAAAIGRGSTENSSPKCIVIPMSHSTRNRSSGNIQTDKGSSATTRSEPVQAISNQDLQNRSKRGLIVNSFDPAVPSDCSGDNKWCLDGSQCIPKKKWCNTIIDCDDKSDETHCTCRELMDEDKVCDHFFDCPDGEDEKGCFGCPEDTFGCDYSLRLTSNATCLHISQRCDGHLDCIDGSDEHECELLSDTINTREAFMVSYTSGYLHRNWQGKWYPACIKIHNEHWWGVQACRSELGVNIKHVDAELLPFHTPYTGKFISHLPDGGIIFQDSCQHQGYAVHVKCPTVPCGNRITPKVFSPRYQSKREIPKERKMRSIRKKREDTDEFDPKVVGGRISKPGHWPWLVALYKDGELQCGGTIIDETWILTAGHCVYGHLSSYFEIYAGILRRLSFSPYEQIRIVTHFIVHPEYSHSDLKNDLALLKLDEPLKFNRWVRPICLPADRPPWGPAPGTMCTAMGWGSTEEHGRHPDNMREVPLLVRPKCKNKADQEGEEICAGFEFGGQDTCQGDSGGPFLCNLPRVHDQWYIAGVVSHGEGCARPHQPGVYTRVALFMPWIVTHTDNKYLTPARRSSHECPGIKCIYSGRCISPKRVCDTIVNCLAAEDEVDCSLSELQSEDTLTLPGTSLASARSHQMGLGSNHSYESPSTESSTSSSPIPTIGNFQSLSQIAESPVGRSAESSTPNKSVPIGERQSLIGKREATSYFICQHLPQRIPLASYCDTEVDCEDGTDEANCACADYLRLDNKSLICDGIIHCYDLSDEKYCLDFNCTNDEFFCFESRTCVPKKVVCDGKKDCPKGEDENICYWPIPIGTRTAVQNQFDIFGVPLFADKGILAENYGGVWKWSCFPEENEMEVPKTVTKLAKRLQFKNYKSYVHLMVFDNEVLNGTGENYCPGLSVDFSVAHVRDESLIPWRVSIFVNGILKCLGVLLEGEWVLTDQSCCLHVNTSTDYIVAVFGSDEKLSKKIRVYEEQIIAVDKIQCLQQTAIMHLFERPKTTRKTKSLRVPSAQQRLKLYKHFLLILEETESYIFELKRISSCSSDSPCYSVVHCTDFCWNLNSSLHFIGVISLSKKNEWIFSGNIEEPLTCLTTEAVITINILEPSLHQEDIVNIREFANRGHNGYRCTLGNQISWENICDGKRDCRENEDESDSSCTEKEILISSRFTPRSCRMNQFRCQNGDCVPKSAICNSIKDCADGTDEPETCSQFTCLAYLNLTNPQKICDAQQDCPDKSDEDARICSSLCGLPTSFRCEKSNRCIPLYFVCDGERDCESGEDEEQCITFLESPQNKTQRSIWIRSHGKWKEECFTTNEMVSFDAEHLCQQFNNSHIVHVEPIQASRDTYSSNIQIKLNKYVGVKLERDAEKELISSEHCQYLHLSCQ